MNAIDQLTRFLDVAAYMLVTGDFPGHAVAGFHEDEAPATILLTLHEGLGPLLGF